MQIRDNFDGLFMSFLLSDIEVDATYHHQRYETLLWHYAKAKNEEGAISDSIVMGTVANKYGGPRTQKEQVMDITNYLIPSTLNRK